MHDFSSCTRQLALLYLAISAWSSPTKDETANIRSQNLIKWGKVFPGLSSNNLVVNCTHQGYPICCAGLDEKKNHIDHPISSKRMAHYGARMDCQTTRHYQPSPYEIEHYMKAQEAMTMPKGERKSFLLDYLTSYGELEKALKWLRSVKGHNKGRVRATDDDHLLLSRFNVTETCLDTHGARHIRHWVEWIEPLTIHARHPFSLRRDRDFNRSFAGFHPQNLSIGPEELEQFVKVSLITPDHVLLKSGQHVDRYHVTSQGEEKNFKYMFDAGTSRFDSSLWWFTCAYHEAGIEFDRLYGWEMTLLEPTEFWRKVPPRWKNDYSFFNAPINSTSDSPDNPFHVMMTMGVKETDFVAFKLDIDKSPVEIPLALQLNSSSLLTSLVDEFFFELHFHCEFLSKIGWGDKMPERVESLVLDRPSALKFFSDLRHKGVRAHLWP